MTLARLLHAGVTAMDLQLPPDTEARLLEFLDLLVRWNQAYNLTAVRDPEQMVPRHLLDSLSVLPYVVGPSVLDIGTGAGLPGIPLALARPDFAFTLLDTNAKKTRFVTQAIHELKLENVTVVQERVEKYRPPHTFATLIARAFAAIPDMLDSCMHLCAPDGRLIAMKGVLPQEEIAAIPAPYRVDAVRSLQVPGLDGARHLVVIRPQ